MLANGSMFKKRKKWRETFPASFLTQQSPLSLLSFPTTANPRFSSATLTLHSWLQGLKYRFLRIYRYFNFTDISKISVDIFSQISMSENYLKLIGMLEKTSKNDKISKNTHF